MFGCGVRGKSAGQGAVLVVGQSDEWRGSSSLSTLSSLGSCTRGGKGSMQVSSEYVGVLLMGKSYTVGTLVMTRLRNVVGKVE